MSAFIVPESVRKFQETIKTIARARRSNTNYYADETHYQSDMMRLFFSLEMMLLELCEAERVGHGKYASMGNMIDALRMKSILPREIVTPLYNLTITRNVFAHARTGSMKLPLDVRAIEDQTAQMFRWYLSEYERGPKLTVMAAKEVLDLPQVVTKSLFISRRAFISYAKEDFEHASSLYDALKSRGHRPWMDKTDLLPGQEWETAIRRAIETSDYFIACLSTRSISKRGYVQKELRFALDVLGLIPAGRIYLIPVRLDHCIVPASLASLHWVDIDSSQSYEPIYKSIESDPE